MQTINPSAIDQFTTDYVLVVDNDFNAYTEIMEKKNTINKNVSMLSDELKAEFETYISQVAEREKENGHEVGALLISQMLIGWGSSSFDRIAKHYIALKTEAEAI
jgi:chorismate synthase